VRLPRALARAGDLVGASPALRSRMVSEVVAGTVTLPSAADGRDTFLEKCLHVYRRHEAPPQPTTQAWAGALVGDVADAFWLALLRARGMASVIWDPRNGPRPQPRGDGRWSVSDLKSGLAAPMPICLDMLAPGADPWRRHYPASDFGGAHESVLDFVDCVKQSTPAEWWTSPNAQTWLERWSKPEQLALLRDIARGTCELEWLEWLPEGPQETTDRLRARFWTSVRNDFFGCRGHLPPVPDGEKLYCVMDAEWERLGALGYDAETHDSDSERSFRYWLQVSESHLTVRVSTRRQVVGRWDEPLGGGNPEVSGSVFFSPRLGCCEIPIEDGSGWSPATERVLFSPAVRFGSFVAARRPDPLGPFHDEASRRLPTPWSLHTKCMKELFEVWRRRWKEEAAKFTQLL